MTLNQYLKEAAKSLVLRTTVAIATLIEIEIPHAV